MSSLPNNIFIKWLNGESLSGAEMENLLKTASDAYYNKDVPIMNDAEFDLLQEQWFLKRENEEKEKNGENGEKVYVKNEVGALPIREKVKLPFYMGSLDKIKPDTQALVQWKKEYTETYVSSCKLDGVSGLYYVDCNGNGNVTEMLFTRGNGEIGQNITRLIPYINGLGLKLGQIKNTNKTDKFEKIAVRGEFIIKKSVFLEKYATTFANPRNMVAGIINQKTIDLQRAGTDRPSLVQVGAPIYDIDFVAYEVILPIMKPSEQMDWLLSNAYNMVWNKVLSYEALTNEYLSELLVNMRKSYIYEVDGIVVYNDFVFERKVGENPKHAFAFKMVLNDQMAEVSVVDVLWSPSKDGYLKPRVQIRPIKLSGVMIEYVTGINAKFISDNGIGKGAIVQIIRSGDVIPKITGVIMPASKNINLMPNVDIFGTFHWNKTNIDLILDNFEDDVTVKEKNITMFFKALNVVGLSHGNVVRVIESGFDTLEKILAMNLAQWNTIKGFKTTMATKIYEGIREAIKQATLINLMVASNMFGRGFSEKRIELIILNYPDILVNTETRENKLKKMLVLDGIADKTANVFLDGIPIFLNFMRNVNLEHKLVLVNMPHIEQPQTSGNEQNHLLNAKTVVFSKIRNKEMEEKLKTVGVKIGDKINKNTYLLIVKDMDDDSSKIKDAKTLGITIITIDDFNKQYLQ